MYVFFWSVWYFDTCDYSGLLRLLQTAAHQMRVHHEKHGMVTSSPRSAKQIMIVENLCKRLYRDDYFENAGYRQGDWNKLPDYTRSHIV